jgi:3-methyl-2-oxobutanoate hydroxymethyltransferase
VPPEVSAIITRNSPVPVIGCGAGKDCDGYVVVTHDMLGLTFRKTPKFVRKYADLAAPMRSAFQQYVDEVHGQKYPGPEHDYPMSEEAKTALADWAKTHS